MTTKPLILSKLTWLSKLDWSTAEKYMCAGNVINAFGFKSGLGNAYQFMQYITHTKNPQIGDVIVIDRYNTIAYKKTPPSTIDGWNYGHVAVIYNIDLTDDTLLISDGLNGKSFTYWISRSKINGFISPEKMIEMGAKNITLNDLQTMGYYEEIFKKEFPAGSSIFKNLDDAKARIGDIAYFIAIGLERSKK